MVSLINFLNDLLWGSVLVYLLIGGGIYFTLRLGFIQFRHFTHMFKVMKNSRKDDESGISSFQALCTSLAARVGTGNMAGVAVAITLGGPGAIFWMWLIAMLGMATAFAESTWRSFSKPVTMTVTSVAARPITWKRVLVCAGWEWFSLSC